MRKSFMPPKEYYKTLPTKRMAAGVLIFNQKKELLILKPNYKDHWTIPGGVIEKNESPKNGCTREIKEEIGVNIKRLKLICIDYVSAKNFKGDSVQFIFTCPMISERTTRKIKIDRKEIVESRFVDSKTALKKLSKNIATRLKEATTALRKNSIAYLEDGKHI